MSNAPCKDCKDRHPACHDRCKVYGDWIALEREKKADLQKRALTEADSMHINNIYKAKRRNHHG